MKRARNIILKTNRCWIVCFALFVFYSLPGLSQQGTITQEELAAYYPKKFISKVELLLGPSVIYPSGNKYLEDERVIKIGFSGGVGVTHNFNPRFGIRFNLLYENKGHKTIWDDIVQDSMPPAHRKIVDDISLYYFTISLFPKYYIVKDHMTIEFGPYVGYLKSMVVTQEIFLNGTHLSRYYTRRHDPYLIHKKFDYGLSLVLGYNFFIKKKNNASIKFSYNLGTVNINIDQNLPHLTKIRNQTLSFQLSYIVNRVHNLNY